MAERLLHLNVNGNGLAKPPASWRQSDPPLWFLDFACWERLGQLAERGLMDAVFLADQLPSVDFAKPWHAFDPFLTLSAVARVTTRIGLVATVSSTFREPFDIARLASTLDVASNGRAAINIVTSQADDAAEQYGRTSLPDRATRSARSPAACAAWPPSSGSHSNCSAPTGRRHGSSSTDPSGARAASAAPTRS